ncbi:MAG TPA: IniB N-terminal domain-containing protein [Amycolatopsis sp.]|nr:IniB N-terminal domain-containing protein [Amycolatopsis sp.]
MDSVQTLHDFTLALLNDPTALTAFAQDPQAALEAVGLGDISAADVHEVMPLVLDTIPVDNLASLGSLPQAGDLTGVLAEGPQGAIDQLQALTSSLGLPAVAVPAGLPALPAVGGELPSVGDVPALGGLGLADVPALSDAPGLSDLQNSAAGITALAQDPTGAFALGNDLSQGLDSEAVAKAGGVVNGVVGQVDQLGSDVSTAAGGAHASALPAAAAGAAAPIGHLTSPLAEAGAGAAGHVSDLAGSVTDQVGNLTGNLNAGGVENAVSGVTHEVGALSHAAPDLGASAADAGSDAHTGTDAGLGAGTGVVHDTVSTVTDLGSHSLGLDVHGGAETSHGGGEFDLHL